RLPPPWRPLLRLVRRPRRLRRRLLRGGTSGGLFLLLVVVALLGGRRGGGGRLLRPQLLVVESEIVDGSARRRGRAERCRRERLPLARHPFRRPERIVEVVLGHVQRNVHRS